MKLKRAWGIFLILGLASSGAFAEPGEPNTMYYVGTRTYKLRIGWTIAKRPLAMKIQLDPATSEIHESLEGGDLNAQIGGHAKPKTFIPVRGSDGLFHIEFEGTEGSGTLQTSIPAKITRSTTTRLFLEGLQWQWQFDIGPERTHVNGAGQFEPGALQINGTVRDSAGHFLINYRDEYEEVSYDEYLSKKQAILSEEAR
jgi:hypothetical protein